LSGLDIISFCGVNDFNLNYLRDTIFPSTQFVLRGENLYIKTSDSDYKLVLKVIDELIFLTKRQGCIDKNDIDLIYHLLSSEVNDNHTLSGNGNKSEIILANKNNFVKPKTPTQLDYFNSILNNEIVFAIGPAGTGKTYLAVAFAISALQNKQVNKVVLARPAVEAGENLGFLPGNLSEKIDPYLKPLLDALDDMLPSDKLQNYLEKNIIEIIPLAYMRGRTLNNSFVILDEAQNATTIQMKMFLTRLGANSRAIVNGDITQIDLPKKSNSGLVQVDKILQGIEGISFVYFKKSDVVRHKLVKEIINAYEKYNDEVI
jgi:phosphate starvation-inducible protein PhoH and related proteins